MTTKTRSDAQAERLAKLYANDAQLRAAKPSAAVALKTSTSSAQVN
ncbi:hypothetical protein [Mycobacterium sp.]|nr:hypothetical protein [Mycobacterium sp.]